MDKVAKRPLIIIAAITGGHAPNRVGPGHPLDHAGIIRDTLACWKAGAAIVHIHARAADGTTTMSPLAYAAIAADIRAAGCDVILDFSAGDDGGRAAHDDRLAIVGTGAEIVSFSGGSFNLGNRLYDNRPAYLAALAYRMAEAGVRPEIEVFDTAQIESVRHLDLAGLKPPFLFQFVCGLAGTLRPDPRLIDLLIGYLPTGSEWSISAQTGDDVAAHAALLHLALERGGHIRTGFEDIRLMNDATSAASNAELVGQWAALARHAGRTLATPAMARQLVGIATLNQQAVTPRQGSAA